MRPLIFTFKRFVLLAGRCARRLAGFAQLTPARLDVLLRLRSRPLWQSELVLDMCVHPSVISRMLKALEKLDLVRRVKDVLDRRQRVVWLTDRALLALQDLWDAEFPDLPELDIQGTAEHAVALHWNPRAEGDAPAFSLKSFAPDTDRQSLLRRMLSTIVRTDFAFWAPGERDPHPRPVPDFPDLATPIPESLVLSRDPKAPSKDRHGNPIARPTKMRRGD